MNGRLGRRDEDEAFAISSGWDERSIADSRSRGCFVLRRAGEAISMQFDGPGATAFQRIPDLRPQKAIRPW